jgi:hypothetical protein
MRQNGSVSKCCCISIPIITLVRKPHEEALVPTGGLRHARAVAVTNQDMTPVAAHVC